MALFAIAIPVLPGKTEGLRAFTKELMSTHHEEFKKSRQDMKVHERTFFQSTPMGDIVIVTLEGNNPQEAMVKFGMATDDFTNWFVAQVKELHGVDLRQPLPGSMPELIADSEA